MISAPTITQPTNNIFVFYSFSTINWQKQENTRTHTHTHTTRVLYRILIVFNDADETILSDGRPHNKRCEQRRESPTIGCVTRGRNTKFPRILRLGRNRQCTGCPKPIRKMYWFFFTSFFSFHLFFFYDRCVLRYFCSFVKNQHAHELRRMTSKPLLLSK